MSVLQERHRVRRKRVAPGQVALGDHEGHERRAVQPPRTAPISPHSKLKDVDPIPPPAVTCTSSHDRPKMTMKMPPVDNAMATLTARSRASTVLGPTTVASSGRRTARPKPTALARPTTSATTRPARTTALQAP